MTYIEQPHAGFSDFIGRFVLSADIEREGCATVDLMCCYRMAEPSGYVCQGLVDEVQSIAVIEKNGHTYIVHARRSAEDEARYETLQGHFRTCRDALLAIADEFPTLGFA